MCGLMLIPVANIGIGFIAGAVLGGPIGAIAGAGLGVVVTGAITGMSN